MATEYSENEQKEEKFGDPVRKILMEYREKRMLAKIARSIGIQPVRLTEMITQDENGEWKRKVTPYYIAKLIDGGFMTVGQVIEGKQFEELTEGQQVYFQRLLIPKKTLKLIRKAQEKGIDVHGLIKAALGNNI